MDDFGNRSLVLRKTLMITWAFVNPPARSPLMLPGHQNALTSAATIMWPLPSPATWCLWCRTMNRARSWGTALQWQIPRCLKPLTVPCPFCLLRNFIMGFGGCWPHVKSLCVVRFPAYDLYLNLSIAPKKLVMGLPWYGYDYPCLSLSEVTCSSNSFT